MGLRRISSGINHQSKEQSPVTKSVRYLLIFTLIASMTGMAVLADTPHHDVLSSTDSDGEVRRWEITGPWGGDVRAMVGSPDNPELLYLGTSDGQIFRSTNGAGTWQRLKPGLGERGLSIDNIVIDPRNTKIMYAGAWAVAQGVEDQGIFKSTDGGEHWQLLKDTKGMIIMSIAIAPSDSNFLIVGDRHGVYRSTDAGKDWTRISPEDNPEIRNINSAAIDPVNTDIIYVGTHHLPWKTSDGGKTWKQTGYKASGMIDDSDIMGISVDPADGSLVYMNACSGIYRSTSSGEKWAKLPGIPFSARRTYALRTHPTMPNVIFAGTSEGLWRSKDGGKRWMLLTSKNVVIRAIVIHPSNPNRVMIATDDFGVRVSNNLGDDFSDANAGFIHRHVLAILPETNERGRLLASVYHDGQAGSVFSSTDKGETWQSASRGLGTRDVFAFFQAADDPSVIYAGTNSGVYRSSDGGASWNYVEKEKAKPAAKPRRKSRRRADAASPAVYSPASDEQYEIQTVAYQRRSSKKRTKKSTRKAPVKKAAPKPAEPAGPPMVELSTQVDDLSGYVDSEGHRVLWAAAMDGLYRTTDETKGWEKIYVGGASRVLSVSVHKQMSEKIFAGTQSGLYISDNGGATWSQVERGPSDMAVKTIAQDPRDPNLVIVGTNQFVYRSTNGGRSWIRRGNGLPAGDYTTVVINPVNPDEMMVSDYSRGGIYRSGDKGYTWERIDTELPSNRVWTITFDPFERDRIYAGSFSSGVYILTIQRGAVSGKATSR